MTESPVARGFLADAAEEAARAEAQRAARKLLMTPLLAADADPEGFRLVRRHLPKLREWFAANTGWRLTDDSAVIRLGKQIVPATATARVIAAHHPALAGRRDRPFNGRRYVLFCLAAAALERADAQTTLGDLAQAVVNLARERDLGALAFTFEAHDERLDLAEAIKLLLRLGAIVRVSGDEDAYVRSGGDAALYDVERRVLARLLSAGQSPARVASGRAGGIDQLERDLHPAPTAYTETERNTAIRRALTIQLLEDPVCYSDELAEAEAAYLTRQRVALTGRIAELTGLEPEIRAEGVAMTDPEERLTDVTMPEIGTDGHVALLIAEQLATAPSVAVSELEAMVANWAKEFATYWRVGAREPGAERALVREAIGKLEALGLVRLEGVGGAARAVGLPAIRRFRFERARRVGAASEPSLFDLAVKETL
ncbi:MAG: TIGR02678 family protein [Bifidobacteriaceae bacterium]|jgi:uncharacterized protein (TIGR02678 family)|nr:TIGR02678 family protein [Bifidobacteriaceae bacterium]